MKRALVLGFILAALSITASAQTNNKAGEKGKTEEQAAPPTVTINPTTIDFKDQVTKKASKPQRITLTNTGGKELYINSAVLEGDNKDDFTISSDTCTGSTIVGNKSCFVDVVFTPAVTERRKATLTITDNAADSPQRVVLGGNGINSAAVRPGD
ncbi:MAG: choice-of-anchor D domain-containing protein [Acidobacteriota bacterium]